jgi:hypothetical protein
MVIRIADKRMYLWRAVDHESEVLDMLVQRQRDGQAAPRSSGAAKQAPHRFGCPQCPVAGGLVAMDIEKPDNGDRRRGIRRKSDDT